MKNVYMYIALVGALMSLQPLSAGNSQLTPGPVVKGVSLAAYANHWDMVSELFVKLPRKEARKQITFNASSLIIPSVTAAVTMLGVKFYEYLKNGYNWRGFDSNGTDWEGYDINGVQINDVKMGYGYHNRDNEPVGKDGRPEDHGQDPQPHIPATKGATLPSTKKTSPSMLKSIWQQTRWFFSSRVYNPWNHTALKAGLVTGALAFTPTLYGMARDYSKNVKAEQEKQVDCIVDIWKEARPYFPEELHNAFDALRELKTKQSSDYETNRTKVLALIRQGISQCPVI